MERHVRKAVFGEPSGHLPYHLHVVSPCRYDEVRDLEPHSLLPENLQRPEHRVEPGGIQFEVDVVVEALEVDVRGVQTLQSFRKGASLMYPLDLSMLRIFFL